MVKYILQLLHSTICNYLVSSAATLADIIFSSPSLSFKEKNKCQTRHSAALCLRGSYVQCVLAVLNLLCRTAWLTHLDPTINCLLAVFKQCDLFFFNLLPVRSCFCLQHIPQSTLQTRSRAHTLRSAAERAMRTGLFSPQTAPMQTLLLTLLHLIFLLYACVVVMLVEWAASLQSCGETIVKRWICFFSHR